MTTDPKRNILGYYSRGQRYRERFSLALKLQLFAFAYSVLACAASYVEMILWSERIEHGSPAGPLEIFARAVQKACQFPLGWIFTGKYRLIVTTGFAGFPLFYLDGLLLSGLLAAMWKRVSKKIANATCESGIFPEE
jgi:hypothetical protein